MATADFGYFLTPAPLSNPFSSDPVYQRILSSYLPPDILSQIQPSLHRFAAEAISESVHDLVRNAESQPPFVKTRNVWGSRPERDRLVTSDGWKQLGKWGLSNGCVFGILVYSTSVKANLGLGLLLMGMRMSLGYIGGLCSMLCRASLVLVSWETANDSSNYIYSASSAAYSCPVSMTSGACRLVRFQLDSMPADHPFHELYAKLTARENSWISAQWMTERAGGSDVRNSETVAVYSPLTTKTGRFGRIDEGDYLLFGFKFFSSATDCNVAFILAKTESGQLSLFVAPTVKTVCGEHGSEKEVTNGIRIHRLKQKFGTKELPTAELELKGVRAHMVGPKDRGIATIAMLLNVTRTHNFITALSCLRRAVEISKSFALSRKTLDQPLWTFPMHLSTLAQLEVKHRGWMQLAFFTTSLLSYSDYGFPDSVPRHYALLAKSPKLTTLVLRALTSTAKAVICKSATLSFQECQEAMGGVGYMGEFPLLNSNVTCQLT